MEKSYVSVFLLLVAISCVLAKDVGKKDTKETNTKPKLPQTLSRGKHKLMNEFFFKQSKILFPIIFCEINFLATHSANIFSSIFYLLLFPYLKPSSFVCPKPSWAQEGWDQI